MAEQFRQRIAFVTLDHLGHDIGEIAGDAGIAVQKVVDEVLIGVDIAGDDLQKVVESAPQRPAGGDLIMAAGGFFEVALRLGAVIGGPKAVVAEVTSAVELTSEERAAIEKRLVDQFGLGLDFRFNVDPDILGGLLIRVGDKLLDTSVASRLLGVSRIAEARTSCSACASRSAAASCGSALSSAMTTVSVGPGSPSMPTMP